MDVRSRDLSESQGGTPELRLILVGNIGCGKTLTINTLLTDSASISPLVPSRVNEVRCGVSEGRRLKLVETPRWYWKGVHVDLSVQRETERALSLVAPGPHAFLILVPVGQFTEMECRIPAELERVFGRGALEHSLVLLTCGDYLTGRDHERYVSLEEPGLGAMVNECGGRWHVINNRRPNDRQQVRSLLEKVEKLTQRTGGCYLPSAMQKEVEERVPEKEYELQRRYSLQEKELVQPDHSTLTQSLWAKEETWEESGRRGKIRVRSMGPATGRVLSQQLVNGLDSQSWYDDSPIGLKQKQPSFKLSKEGAILSQMSETDQPVKNQSNHNYINTIHYQISTTDDTSSAPTSPKSPTATITSYSPSSNAFSSLSSAPFSLSSSSSAFSTSSSTNFSSYSSAALTSSPSNAPFSSSSNALFPSSSTAISSSSSTAISSSPTNAPTSTNGLISSTRPNNTSFSSSSTATYTAFPKTNTSFLSSSNAASSSSPSTNTSFLSSSTSVSSSPSTNTAFSSSSPSVSSSPSTNTAFSSSSPSVSSSPSTNTAFSSSSPSVSSSPSTNNPFLSSSTSVSSSPSTNTTFLSSSNALFSRSTAASSFSFPSDSSNELRLVLLGRSGSGKSAAGNAILGRDEFKLRKDDATGATTQTCVKGTAVVGQKQLAVVDTPDWFSPSCPPETLATHLSSCIDLCAPGPHAFLLCVPITLPGRSNLHDLASIRNSFGNDFIQRCTLVLFTHCDILKDVKVEEYIAAKRPELLELVEKCGDRYHVLKQDRNGDNIKDLLEKVEQVIKENRRSHYSYQGEGETGKEKTAQLRRGRGGEDDLDRAVSNTLHSLKEEEEIEQDEKKVKPAQSTATSVTSVLGSVLRFVGQKVGEGAKQVPKLVAGGAMLGGVLGLYVGGPVGGAVGATAGSVAAEYGRRKYNKPKTD
ncbi:uncharacterized protein LOC124388938 [Silurus meridionalis]|uniref:AIG1-type G domain-containing protein n=1 Tax=Silurus meridionalis TaxID=175797 RepID=A0A8T0BV92_SILME|nr:uncharacterized protein LOC124388938 [Silurus meridionalis]KAF7711202.1 hypothetical protein HF521_000213 [Silurus meridionalis]